MSRKVTPDELEADRIYTLNHKRVAHLSRDCPYVESDAVEKPVSVFVEIDLCSWCDTRVR